MKNSFLLFLFGLFVISCQPEKSKKEILKGLLGEFPERPKLSIDTLETVQLEKGIRYKIAYLSEPADTLFDEPEDWIKAYLFVPNHKKGKKLPAIIAIHQDGPQSHLGKLETAGIEGNIQLYYGLELFERGYVVICPDRIGHAERRRIAEGDTSNIEDSRDLKLISHQAGQLHLKGRTTWGKEAYDLTRAVDVLLTFDFVNKEKIGAIGHSAGGAVLPYFMFIDERVTIGVSNCGYFELLNFYNENVASKRYAYSSIPNLAKVGNSNDYLTYLAPRPLMLTRGLWEWGRNGEWGQHSLNHVNETKKIEAYVRPFYEHHNASENFKVIYFDEDGGNHAFPSNLKKQVYNWIDSYLLE